MNEKNNRKGIKDAKNEIAPRSEETLQANFIGKN